MKKPTPQDWYETKMTAYYCEDCGKSKASKLRHYQAVLFAGLVLGTCMGIASSIVMLFFGAIIMGAP